MPDKRTVIPLSFLLDAVAYPGGLRGMLRYWRRCNVGQWRNVMYHCCQLIHIEV